MERKSLEEIRSAAREVERLQAGLEAGRLSVTVAGRKDIRIAVQEDFAAQADRSLAAGQVLRLQAGGRIRIVHPDMEIEVRSGQADAEARVQKAREAERRLAAALAASGAATPADAESRWSAYEPLSADLAAAEKALAEELDGEPLSAFEKRAAAPVLRAPAVPLPTSPRSWAGAMPRQRRNGATSTAFASASPGGNRRTAAAQG